MKIWPSLLAVVILAALAWLGALYSNLHFLLGVLIPYMALALFLAGFIHRVIKWGRSPVPFSIPTTCGQQKSLPWIRQAGIENPASMGGVIARMAGEILLFRSLFRNTETEKAGGKLGIGSTQWLWLGGLVFHWSFLIVMLRHLRLFVEPVPAFVQGLQNLDGFLQMGIPVLYLTDVFLVVALTYLLVRRVLVPRIRYISLAADYFPLFLLLGIAASGILMRYFIRVDIINVKEHLLGLFKFSPMVTAESGAIFYIHLFLVSCLLVYFPFSKLMHLGGIFMSPTRNMANNSRFIRHINPWNYEVKTHSYQEYEEEFREKMQDAGLPLDKEDMDNVKTTG